MRKIVTPDYLHDSYSVKLFDMRIADVQERVKNAMPFKKAVQAANFLGMPPNKFYEAIGPGRYAYHRETGAKYAVRKMSA